MPKQVSTLTFEDPSRLESSGMDWELCSLEFRNGRLIITNKQTGEAQDCVKTGVYPVFDMDEALYARCLRVQLSRNLPINDGVPCPIRSGS